MQLFSVGQYASTCGLSFKSMESGQSGLTLQPAATSVVVEPRNRTGPAPTLLLKMVGMSVLGLLCRRYHATTKPALVKEKFVPDVII